MRFPLLRMNSIIILLFRIIIIIAVLITVTAGVIITACARGLTEGLQEHVHGASARAQLGDGSGSAGLVR